MGRRRGGTAALPRAERLRAGEFQALFEQRARREERATFIALWRPRSEGTKVGFAVGRRIGGAVDRNRARRRLREAYRRQRAGFPLKVEVVFLARPAVLTRSFTEVLEEMRGTMHAMTRVAAGASR